MRLTASNIVTAINNLPKDRIYDYINPSTTTKIKIMHVTRPEGPITIKRFNPAAIKPLSEVKEETISSQMIWRIANAFVPHQPINFDRVLGASYNNRSAFEALLAHTPEFYYCYPGRIESISTSTKVKRGHKHLVWCPDEPHQPGVMVEKKVHQVISEIPNIDVVYDALTLPEAVTKDIDIDVARRHSQIQIALIMIGQQLGFRTWIAQNDKGIVYKGRRIGELNTVVDTLESEKLISAFEGARQAALLIDCIWFKNGRLMPAVMEVEHSTGVTSGLTRMKNLQDRLPPILTRYVIVAPDEDREKVYRKANKPQFQSLNTRYFPYSAVEELYSLCQRRKIRGVTEEFLDCFMEPTIA